MALIDKLTAIADGFRASRGTTDKYSLDDMAAMAAETSSGGGSSSHRNVKTKYDFDIVTSVAKVEG